MACADDELDRLTELVGDERARRTRTEKQLADQKAETSRWRRRARMAEAASRISLKLPSRPGRQARSPSAPLRNIAFPAVRVGVSGAPEWLALALDTVPLEDLDEAGWAMLDAVVVGGSTVPPGLRSWLDLPARQPLILWHATGDLAELARGAETALVVAPSEIGGCSATNLANPIERVPASSALKATTVARRVALTARATHPALARAMLAAAGIDLPDPHPSVSVIAITNRPDRLRPLMETLAELRSDDLRVELATHGFTLDRRITELASSRFEDRISIRELPAEWPLGRCLNHVIEGTATDVWAKIDDDDFYGPLYLQEAMIELLTTGADLVGKQTHYLYDSSKDETYLLQPGNEYQDTAYVPGATFVGRRGAWERVPFAHRHARVDSTFVRGMRAVGLSIYSTSRFEFAVGRGAEGHTWHVDDSFYEARGRLVGPGMRRGDIFLTESDWPPDEQAD